MERQYIQLVHCGQELSSNEMIGGRGTIAEEMASLQMRWGPMKDNVFASLDILTRLAFHPCLLSYNTLTALMVFSECQYFFTVQYNVV